MHPDRAIPRHPLPSPATTRSRSQETETHPGQRPSAHRIRASESFDRHQQRQEREPGDMSDLGVGTRRGKLLVFTVEHVSDRRRGRTNRERRRTATHPPKAIPELLADGPSQVWTWDITKLRGPTKGVWFHLYVLIDIYSRYNPSWIVAAHESAELAAEFIAEAIERNGIAPHTVHADRGTSMTSGLVSELLGWVPV